MVIAATNKLHAKIKPDQTRKSEIIKVPTRHSDVCVRSRKVINRHAKVAKVGSQNHVVDEIAMPVIYLTIKLISDVRKLVTTDTDRRFHQVGAQPHIRK